MEGKVIWKTGKKWEISDDDWKNFALIEHAEGNLIA